MAKRKPKAEEEESRPRVYKGLAAMTPEKRKAVQRAGALALWRQGKAHQFSREEAAKGRARQRAMAFERAEGRVVRQKEREQGIVTYQPTAKGRLPKWLREDEEEMARWRELYEGYVKRLTGEDEEEDE